MLPWIRRPHPPAEPLLLLQGSSPKTEPRRDEGESVLEKGTLPLPSRPARAPARYTTPAKPNRHRRRGTSPPPTEWPDCTPGNLLDGRQCGRRVRAGRQAWALHPPPAPPGAAPRRWLLHLLSRGNWPAKQRSRKSSQTIRA